MYRVVIELFFSPFRQPDHVDSPASVVGSYVDYRNLCFRSRCAINVSAFPTVRLEAPSKPCAQNRALPCANRLRDGEGRKARRHGFLLLSVVAPFPAQGSYTVWLSDETHRTLTNSSKHFLRMGSDFPIRTMSMPTSKWEKDAVFSPYQIRRNISAGSSTFRHGPLLISISLFIWSLTVFSHSAFRAEQTGCGERNHEKSASEFDSPFSSKRAIQNTRQVAGALGEKDDFPRHRILISKSASDLDFSQSMPSLTIFCAPKPYMDDPSKCEQRRALLSWLRLSPAIKVVLLGEDPSFRALQAEFPGFVSVEPNLDFNFRGVPQFHSMIARAEAADTAFSMVINADIILLNDLMPAIQRVASNFDNWMLTASRWDVAEGFPFNFEGTSSQVHNLATSEFDTSVRKYVRANGSLHTYGGVDFWLWNKSPVPLFSGAMPPFTFGRAKYDNWLTHEVVAAGLRDMVDASDAVTSVHVAHSYSHVSVSKGAAAKVDAGKSFWSLRKQSSWEIFQNIHLAQSYGTYRNQLGTALHTPWKLASCHEPTGVPSHLFIRTLMTQ